MACWIESHTVLMRHRKVAELARGLRIRRAHAMGHLHALWHAALEQQDDGNLSEWSDEFVAEMSDVSIDAPQYVRLLQKTGFLGYKDESGTAIEKRSRLIHDWTHYAGPYLINKYASGNRQRLVSIWDMHGRIYGERKSRNLNASETQPESNHTLPDHTNLTIPTHPPNGGGGRKVASAAESALELKIRSDLAAAGIK